MKRLFVKVIRDLLKDKSRLAITLIAIIFGTTAFGITTFSYTLAQRELSEGFMTINPSSGNIMVEKIDDKFTELTKGFKEIGDFEEKGYYELRLRLGENKWKTLHLFAIKDFDNMKVNKITSERGAFDTGKNEILIERDALGVADTGLNKNISIDMPDSSLKEFKVVGIVHDLTTHPASVENIIPVYVSYETLQDLGLKPNRVDFILSNNKYDRASIFAVGNDYIKLLEMNGFKVKGIDVLSQPGKTIHQVEYDAVLFILRIVSFLAFILGCIIMSNLLSNILSSQIKQIGILKSIGSSTRKIFLAYMSAVLALVFIIVAISTPLSIALARRFAILIMKLGNMDVSTTGIPMGQIAVFCLLGIVAPIIIAIIPIRRGVVITVKEALNNYGTTQTNTFMSKLSNLKVLSKMFTRPVLLSIRNATRRKGRFYLNFLSLTLGGGLFIASIIGVFALNNTITKDIENYSYDYQFQTSNAAEDEILAQVFKDIPEVKEYENWGSTSGKIKYVDGKVGSTYTIVGLNSNNKTFKPEIMEGRWISENDTNEIVVGHQFFPSEEQFKFGDIVSFKIGDKELQFKIVGTIKELGSPTVFLNKKGFDDLITNENKKNSIKIITQPNVKEKESLYNKVEDKLKENGVIIFQSESIADLLEVLNSHGSLVVSFFVVIAVVILVVAGFGLTSSMCTQVSERTREVGIMKAMGASKRQISRIVTAESIFICGISWIFSIGIGLLFGILVANIMGNIIVCTPLSIDFARSYIPICIWLILSFVLGYFASRTAAKRAVEMSVKETLAFE